MDKNKEFHDSRIKAVHKSFKSNIEHLKKSFHQNDLTENQPVNCSDASCAIYNMIGRIERAAVSGAPSCSIIVPKILAKDVKTFFGDMGFDVSEVDYYENANDSIKYKIINVIV